MSRLMACLAAAIALAGCGETDANPESLDRAFARTWTGDYTMTCTGVGTVRYPGVTTTLTVSGSEMDAWLACSDGSGSSVVATGTGRTATWTGSFSCPPSVMGACSSWVFSRTSVTYVLGATGDLTATGVGSLTGCGFSTGCTTSFYGQ